MQPETVPSPSPLLADYFARKFTMLSLIFIFTFFIFTNVASTEVASKEFVMNLHHDHCPSPMMFSMEKMLCECPQPLERSGNRCVCPDCFRITVEERYNETELTDLPEYINDVFESLDR